MMSFLYMMVIGAIASLSARLLRDAEEWMDLVMALILGIAGSFLGGILANVFGLSMSGNWLAIGLSVAFSLIGALILVVGYEYLHAQRYGDDYNEDDDEYYDDDYDEDDDEH